MCLQICVLLFLLEQRPQFQTDLRPSSSWNSVFPALNWTASSLEQRPHSGAESASSFPLEQRPLLPRSVQPQEGFFLSNSPAEKCYQVLLKLKGVTQKTTLLGQALKVPRS